MIVSIATTHRPATDLGYLLHKNPARAHQIALGTGTAWVVFPRADEERCEAVLILDVDPLELLRGPVGARHYVNDRPYAASSLLAVAIGKAFGTALSGRSKERPALAGEAIPLQARIPAVRARGGADEVRALFEPLGWQVEARAVGAGVHDVRLDGRARLQDLLAHLVVLIPVLDDDKHYWIGADEVDKLMRRGGAWLAAHPAREAIARRYLKHQRSLATEALDRLADAEPAVEAGQEEDLERPVALAEQRERAVLDALRSAGARTVVDAGCGEGRLLRTLLADTTFTRLVGMDVSIRALQRARERLRLDRMGEQQRRRIELLHGSLTYRDARLAGFDAAVAVEVLEHLEPDRLGAFERVLFAEAHPPTVVLTTPNAEYNTLFPGLAPGELRHRDHRFEWTREQFQGWARGVADAHGYAARFEGVGPADEARGAPTQMAVFSR